MKQRIKKCIENLTSGWYREIQECKKYNCGFNGNIGKVGEILSACMLDSMCTGTSGMGYDLWDKNFKWEMKLNLHLYYNQNSVKNVNVK